MSCELIVSSSLDVQPAGHHEGGSSDCRPQAGGAAGIMHDDCCIMMIAVGPKVA